MSGTQTERARDRTISPASRPPSTSIATAACCSSAASSRRCTACSSRARCTARRTSTPARRPCPSASARRSTPDDYVAGTYRGHGHALAKGTDPEALAAEMLGRASGICGGRARLDERHRPRARARRLLRHRRRQRSPPPPARRFGAAPGQRRGRRSSATAPSNQALLPRVPELRRGPRAAGRVRLREQPLRRVHADGEQVTAGGDIAGRARPRTACRRGASTATTSGRCARPRARRSTRARARRRPDAARVPDLPPLRPLEVRPGDVPARRTRSSTGWSAIRSSSRARGCSTLGVERARSSPRPRTTRSTRRSSARSRRALAAPYPDPDEDAGDGVQAASELEFRDAIRDALAEEIERDPSASSSSARTSAPPGGVFKATPGLHERFGHERVFDTPISELAHGRRGVRRRRHRAAPGHRDHVRRLHGAADGHLVNQSAKYWYVSNEQASVPLVVRSAVGAGGRFGAIHSQIHGDLVPGHARPQDRRPVDPADAKGLLKAAIRDDNPVIFLEHKRLYSLKGPAPTEDDRRRSARRRMRARAATSRSSSALRGVRDALEAAEELARRRHRRRGGRPALAAAARPRDGARVDCEDQPADGRRRGHACRAAGPRACSGSSPRRASTISTTPGSSRRGHARSLQPEPRGRVAARTRRDRGGRARAAGRRRAVVAFGPCSIT